MDFKDMTIEQLEERKAEIAEAVDAPEADLDALENEAESSGKKLKSAEQKKQSAMRSATLSQWAKA